MNIATEKSQSANGWLDSIAISMSLLCLVHCLITPALLVILPFLATSFWVHQDFHLWLLFIVLPTACVAFFLGCRKHKDKAVIILGVSGLLLLAAVAGYESILHSGSHTVDHGICAHCSGHSESGFWNASALINTLGGMLLLCGHLRNFILCRRGCCTHH